MNWDRVKPLATVVFTAGLKVTGAALVTHGYITGGTGLETFTGAAMAAGATVWQWWVEDGAAQAVSWFKHLTETATKAAAIEVAKRMQPGAITGAVLDAKVKVDAGDPPLVTSVPK
jgi:hypothetical protein